ncbi:MAG: hypothetical protein EA361_07105 [Bacteroidetes bacterium]|nr:MAG: hypothetical protein EA361_07105 [Bacteroidota bacterium]
MYREFKVLIRDKCILLCKNRNYFHVGHLFCCSGPMQKVIKGYSGCLKGVFVLDIFQTDRQGF